MTVAVDTTERNRLVKNLTKELSEQNLAIFAGAGLSVPAGYVGWNKLLEPIAEELKLDIEQEASNLVALAQYYANENAGNRGHLNQLLIEEFCKKAAVTDNHRILARLPIDTYWTTNYDKLIEQSLSAAGKVPDVKYEMRQLVYTKPRRDAIVYKMHGDIGHPADAVLIKDDYEKYHVDRQPFLNALQGDLIAKTFLFLGFSFADPNLDYILSRVRVAYNKDQRQHYCILRTVQREEGEDKATFEYRRRKQKYFIQDLRRFGIKPFLVDEYSEITEILRQTEKRFRRKTAFVSGAAHTYEPHGKDAAEQFVFDLSRDIINNGMTIVSGFGLGVGSAVITGALDTIYMSGESLANGQLIMRPFPQAHTGERDLGRLWTQYRKDMVSYAGVAIFLYGNKLVDDRVVLSDGMREEFEIAKRKGLFLIPVGATGSMAKELWNEVRDSYETLYPNADPKIRQHFEQLGDSSADLADLRRDVMAILRLLVK